MVQWYYAVAGQQHGPISDQQLKEMIAAGQIRPDDMVWNETLPQWVVARAVPGLFTGLGPPPMTGAASYDESKRIIAGVCALLLGSLGVHKFILGRTGAGMIMLLVTVLTCGVGGLVMSVIGIAEGIIYLTRSDADFYQTYIVEGKDWF